MGEALHSGHRGWSISSDWRRARTATVAGLAIAVVASTAHADDTPGTPASESTEAGAPELPKVDRWVELEPPPGESEPPLGEAEERTVRKRSPPTFHRGRRHPSLLDERQLSERRPNRWIEWNYMTGDWGGARPWLAKRGVLFELIYTAEFFSRVKGGDPSERSTSGLGNLDLTLTLNTERLGWWKGGTFFFYFQNLVGNGNQINAAVGGAVVELSTLNAESFTQLSAYYFEQVLFDGVWRLKLGKQDANSEFQVSEITAEFINAAFSPTPNVPWPTFPDPGLALVTQITPANWLRILAGIYGAELDGKSFQDGGLFSGKVIAPIEVSFLPTFLGRYAGTYRLGAWYSTLDTPEIVPSNAPEPGVVDDNYGFYLVFDQPVFLEPSAKDSAGPGLEIFVEYSWAPGDRNRIVNFVGAGALYTGAIPTRDYDEIGFAFTFVTLSDRLEPDGLTNQTAFEWFYKAFLTPWFVLQPDVQWLLNVGGNGPRAVAVGARAAVSF